MIPKKTYVSYAAKREFAAINIKSKEIRLGMDLGDQPFTEDLEKAKLTGPMPRISHMIVVREKNDFNAGEKKKKKKKKNLRPSNAKRIKIKSCCR